MTDPLFFSIVTASVVLLNIFMIFSTDLYRAYCLDSLLDPEKVKGKILACLNWKMDPVVEGNAVQQAGAVGMILCSDPDAGFDVPLKFTIPATYISTTDCQKLFRYVNSTGYMYFLCFKFCW